MTTDPDAPARIVDATVLADDWGRLTRYDFDLRLRDGTWDRQRREVYDRGNGAVCLLHDPARGTVLLTRQFRLPSFVNGGISHLIEAPAGLLDGAAPADRIRHELVEETGFDVAALTHAFDLYMSPGSVSEYLAFFEGTYAPGDRVGDGGGSDDEGEDIEVLEVPLDEALAMIDRGEIRDAKTVILIQRLKLRLLGAV